MGNFDPESFRKTLDIDPASRYVLYSAGALTGTGAASDSIVYIAVIPWKRWRVVNCGFAVKAAGTSTIAEKLNIGVQASDIGATDDDYFGSWVQDVDAGENLAIGDMLQRVNMPELATPAAPANGGSHTFTAGTPDGLNVWQTSPAIISGTKKTVGSSTATLLPWAIVELGEDLFVRG